MHVSLNCSKAFPLSSFSLSDQKLDAGKLGNKATCMHLEAEMDPPCPQTMHIYITEGQGVRLSCARVQHWMNQTHMHVYAHTHTPTWKSEPLCNQAVCTQHLLVSTQTPSSRVVPSGDGHTALPFQRRKSFLPPDVSHQSMEWWHWLHWESINRKFHLMHTYHQVANIYYIL